MSPAAIGDVLFGGFVATVALDVRAAYGRRQDPPWSWSSVRARRILNLVQAVYVAFVTAVVGATVVADPDLARSTWGAAGSATALVLNGSVVVYAVVIDRRLRRERAQERAAAAEFERAEQR